MAGGDSASTAGEHAGCPGETAKPGEYDRPPQAGELLSPKTQGKMGTERRRPLFWALHPATSLTPRLYLPTLLSPPERGVTLQQGTRGSEVLPPGRVGRALFSCPYLPWPEETLSRRTNSNRTCLLFALGLEVPVAPQLGLLFPDLGFTPKQFSPCISYSLPSTPRSACPLIPQLLAFLESQWCAKYH